MLSYAGTLALRGAMQFRKNALFSIIACILIFSVIEIGLYASGFQYSRFPKFAMHKAANWWSENGWANFEFVMHPIRMWALKPGVSPTNIYGYQGRPVPVENIPGFKKILFLGDSCTNTWVGNYPVKTVMKLKERHGVNMTPIIAGTPGYSTAQGVRWLPEFLAHKPDVLVVYFGWNDHWFATSGIPDNEFAPLTKIDITIKKFLSISKIYQLLHYLIYPPVEKLIHVFSEKSFEDNLMNYMQHTRVPPEYFIANVKRIIDIAQSNNMEVYFIRAPYGKHLDEQADSDFNWLAGPVFRYEVSTLHEAYNYMLEKTVATYHDVHLINFKDVEFDRTMMMEDGIHPLSKGYDLIAERLVSKMSETSSLLIGNSNRVGSENNLISQN